MAYLDRYLDIFPTKRFCFGEMHFNELFSQFTSPSHISLAIHLAPNSVPDHSIRLSTFAAKPRAGVITVMETAGQR